MLLGILKKELRLTFRDVHAVAVLFVLPMAFILIMSLALQDVDGQQQKQFKVGLIFESDTTVSQRDDLLQQLRNPEFEFLVFASMDAFRQHQRAQDLIAGVQLHGDFFQQLKEPQAGSASQRPMQIYFSATTPQVMRQLLLAALHQSVAAYQIEQKIQQQTSSALLREGLKQKYMGTHLFEVKTLQDSVSQAMPSSVQQSVPAWLIFSMFFVVIPIATTFIIEKQNGTLQRLMTLPVSSRLLLLGKLIPYLAINMVQSVLMFLVGIYLVPLFGGQGLVLADNAWLLIPMAFSVGVLAICLALFIATLVRSTEQATTIGGIVNLLLAAIGGIMVPTYVMPELMRHIATYSPMNWGLEGFLTILLRQGNLSDIAEPIGKLLGLAALFFALAVMKYRRAIV